MDAEDWSLMEGCSFKSHMWDKDGGLFYKDPYMG